MLKRILKNLENFFSISPKQARGTALMIALMMAIIWSPFIFRRFILPHFSAPEIPVNERQLDSLAAIIDSQYTEKDSEKSTFKSYDKRPAKPQRLFQFNPNTASVEELEELGVPAFIARRIDKYRSKGGQFRKKEELLKIYDFPEELFHQLETYIILPQNSLTPAGMPERARPNTPTIENNRISATKDSKSIRGTAISGFDINTADTSMLIQLRGIGSKLSARIIKFRDGLGGFHSVSQYSEVYGLDSLALTELHKYAKIQSPVNKIRINEATAVELSVHAYLRNKKLAQVIVNYRTQHGGYKSIEDLKKITVLDDATVKKLAPYLEF